ncbi:MAG: AAA family ATPase [Chloroflexi bacterium]|nr:AAA family ATPase [Chloroflexota bacterium]
MTTQPAPVPEGYATPDMLPPQDGAYVERLKTALRCGVPGCSCENPGRFHCPSHDNPDVPTLSVTWNPKHGVSFECTRCPFAKVLDALARRGLMPRTHLYSSSGAQEAGLQPLNLLIQQPTDWLWPNRIPLGKLTLIAGYPSSGKTSIALDIAARASRGAAAPDQPDALFPYAPVVLALLNGNPKSDVLPVLRLFGAELGRIYLADLLSPTHPIDYYPDDPPNDDDEDDPRYDDDDRDDEDEEEYLFDNDGNEIRVPRRRPVGVRVPPPLPWKPPSDPATDFTAPWPGLNKVMRRLASLIEAGSAALLIVDQVEDLASMHRAQPATVLGMLKALAARSGAAVVALTHNPAPNYPRAVAAMQRRLAQASVVFTTAVVEPGGRRFLIPLRPAMSDDAPAIPYVLPSTDAVAVAWRKPVFPAHINALADPNRDQGARTRAARSLLMRALADGPRPAAQVEREAAMLGISRSTLVRARVLCNVKAFRVSTPGVPSGPGAWYWSIPDTHAEHDAEHDAPPNL